MKLLLLSLLPLAAKLAVARPAYQEDAAALMKRQWPEDQEPPADPKPDSDEPKPDQPSSSWLFAPGSGYAQSLNVDFPTESEGRFLGLNDDQVADLKSIFTDDTQDLDVAIVPGLKLDDSVGFSTAFLSNDGTSDPSADFGQKEDSLEDLNQDASNKDANKPTYDRYSPENIPELERPIFDPKFTSGFDPEGLPVVQFSPDEDYSTTIDIPLPNASAEPNPGDYTDFFTPPPF